MTLSATYASVVQSTQKEIWVTSYGAVGNGSTNDTVDFQAALTAATAANNGTVVRVPVGVYKVNASLLYGGNMSIIGDTGAIIQVISGTALTTPVLCYSGWYNNSTSSGFPVYISDLAIDGNSATSGSGAHGLVGMNYWSAFERISISNVAGDGFRFSAYNRGGTHITNTCVEPKVRQIQVRNVGGDGIRVNDDGAVLNSCTDGFLEDCIVQNATLNAINIDMCPGWKVTGNHVYGSLLGGIQLNRCYATRVISNYVDGFASSGSGTFGSGLSMTCLDGRASSCIANTIGFESSTSTGPNSGIVITGSGSNRTICEVAFNSVNGNSQSGSNGYVIQTNVSQQTHPWIVYFHDNDAQNVNHYIYNDGYATGGDVQVAHHIASVQYVAPTAAPGANAGTSPPAPVLTNCSDADGKITFGTGSGTPAIGAQVVVTFNKPYATAPNVICQPINDATSALRWNVTSTTTTFTYNVGVAPGVSQSNTVYGFSYHVMA